MATRWFEFVDGNSSKFWAIELQEQTITTWWGRIGTDGQSKTKDLGSTAKAQSECDKLIEEKTKKGYEEVAYDFNENDEWTSIEEKLRPYSRPAWKPIVGGNAESELLASKFSGIPWISLTEGWPQCKRCGDPMQLFVQLNLLAVPDEIKDRFGDGLLQLFYCVTGLRDGQGDWSACWIEQKAYSGNDTTMLIRIIEPTENPSPFTCSPVFKAFPSREITGWTLLPPEYPDSEELKYLVEFSDEEQEIYEDEYETRFSPYDGDKLSGWPFWRQGAEYGVCKICQTEMQLVFQISSDCNLQYAFNPSKGGVGYITQCPTHKEQMKFRWAC